MKIFIRHAEKAYSNGAAEDKKHDPPLTDNGKKSCILKAEELVKLYGKPKLILCSPYRRCRETAEALRIGLYGREFEHEAKEFLNEIIKEEEEVAILVEPKLAEYLGNHKNSKLDITDETASYGIDHPENWRQFTKRINTYVDSDLFNPFKEPKNSVDRPIWIVTHGVVIGHIFKHLGLQHKKNYDYLDCEILDDIKTVIQGEKTEKPTP